MYQKRRNKIINPCNEGENAASTPDLQTLFNYESSSPPHKDT